MTLRISTPYRSTSARACAGVLVLFTSLAAQQTPPAAGPPQMHSEAWRKNVEQGLAANVPDGFTLAATGDLLLTQPVSSLRDAGFQTAVGWVKAADVSFGNLEMTMLDIRNFKGYPAPTTDGMRPTGTPDIAADLKAMGFKLVSRANNHTLDWGVEGMHATDRAVDEAGIVRAGDGDNEAAARTARFLSTPTGRIGLVALAATFEMTEPALPPTGEVPGQPGVSVLRTTQRVTLEAPAMNDLRRVLTAAGGREFTESAAMGDPNSLTLNGTRFVQGEKPGSEFIVNQHDLDAILYAIRQGKLTCDFLIVSVHSHQSGSTGDDPAPFFVSLAHAAIDAGADAVVGHGPHNPRGIEIYKGKPIFYSLGNFYFQVATQNLLGADMYERLLSRPGATTEAELQQGIIGTAVESRASYYESVVATATFRHGVVSEITLHPIELNQHGRMADRGIPHAATGDVAQRVLQRVAHLSEPFGTRIDIRDGVGYIRAAP